MSKTPDIVEAVDVAASPQLVQRPTGPRLFADCALLGLTAWGGYMALLAQAQERFVRQRQWIAEKDFLDLIALVTLLPGPQAVNALAVMGYRVSGWSGFVAALSGIVAPGFAIILALWWAYSSLAGHPDVLQALTLGVLPPLALILGQAAANQAKKATPERRHRILAAACAVLLLLGARFWAAPIAVLAFGSLVSLLFWPEPMVVQPQRGRRLKPLHFMLCMAPAGLAVFQLFPALLPQQLIAKVGLAFAGLSTTLFGGGLVMVPLLEGLLVGHLGWLSHASFSAGLAASQLTPGPILSIATFTGMEVGGVAAALAATLGIYLPTALISVGGSGIADRLKGARRFQHAMVGVRCAVVGLIAGAAFSLLIKLPWQTFAWQNVVLITAAYGVVWRLKQAPYVSLPVGALLAWLLIRLG
jgi:chromate transporter